MNAKKNKWVICAVCEGEGKHSRHLGSFSMDEFQSEFSLEEQEAYFDGAYDCQCDNCDGTGKVIEEQLTTEEQQERSNVDWENYYEQQRGA